MRGKIQRIRLIAKTIFKNRKNEGNMKVSPGGIEPPFQV